MSNYRKGRSAENYIKRKLVSMGYFAVRVAGSKPIDLVISKGDLVYAVEVKAEMLGSVRAHNEFQALGEKVVDTPLIPVLIYKRKNRWLSEPREVLGVGTPHES